MLKRLVTLTSLLQILSLVGFMILILLLARLLHHQSSDVFIPFWDYVSSFQIAFPPMLILFATYGLAFFAGKKLSDVPSHTVAFLRNKFFQSHRMMTTFVFVVFIVSTFGFVRTETTVPPHYEKLVSAILVGEIDKSEEAKKVISLVSSKNPTFAEQLSLVQQVFELRRQINLDAKNHNLIKARVLIRALKLSDDIDWKAHPLRNHALAEAHSLLADAVNRSGKLSGLLGNLEPNELFDEAILLYTKVRRDGPGRLATEQLKASALNNIGNVHWYRGEYQKALDAWLEIEQQHPQFKNVGTLANMVAGNIVLGKHEEAVRLGIKARNWADKNGKDLTDTNHYVSILVNTGFALVTMGEIEDSVDFFEFAALIENDDNTKLNLALSHAMSHRPSAAERVLREVSSPINHREISETKSYSSDVRCSYLWWALYSKETDPRDVAARLFVFLGEKHSESEMQKFRDKKELAKLRNRVASELDRFPGSCSTYSLMEPIVDFVRGT